MGLKDGLTNRQTQARACGVVHDILINIKRLGDFVNHRKRELRSFIGNHKAQVGSAAQTFNMYLAGFVTEFCGVMNQALYDLFDQSYISLDVL